ncbi:MAG: 1,4-dihydroxy-2-naphthoate octaprenyltransferase [Chitinophagales bacterium]
MNIKPWIQAARLRTLPLAFSCIITGAAIAIQNNVFNPIIFILALLTTLLLQVLSNYANDYGDAVSGKDKDRVGEKRMVASGEIAKEAMKKSIYLFSFLSFISGLLLIIYSFNNYFYIILFIVLGLAAIWAAIKYTVGKNPYGYSGYGDLFVFLFFGIVGVVGSSILYTTDLDYIILLPAFSIGLLSTAVLTLNNLRDIENDAKTAKNTLIVKMGFAKGKSYFASLILLSQLTMIAYAILSHFENRQYLFLLASILLSGILKKVLNTNKPEQMDPFLKQTAIATFTFSLLFLLAMLY